MNTGKLKQSIYIDKLTGLPNFFKFIESDFNSLFCDNGVVIIFNTECLSINQTSGENRGDLCLKKLSGIISNTVLANSNIAVFRTHSDELTVIVPNYQSEEIENKINMLKKDFEKILQNYGFHYEDLHTNILSYNSKIQSIESYYTLLLNDIRRRIPDDKLNGESIVNHLIGGIINRVKDTLTYYYDAQSYAFIDDISGIQNHRAGRLYITDLIEEFKEKSVISVLFIDGDNLKRYNDINYEAGNQMIRNLSNIISDTIREDDKVYRWLSGDEFLVVLKETNEIKSLSSAERIRQAVEKKTNDLIYPVTVSIGIANYPKDGNTIDEIINKAERANCIAKNSGKNKVVIWGN